MIDLDAWDLTEGSALFQNVDDIPPTIGHPRYSGCMAGLGTGAKSMTSDPVSIR